MRIICRLYGDGVLVCRETVEVPEPPAEGPFLERLVHSHREVLKDYSVHMVELVFPDGTYFRGGTDASLMVKPVRVSGFNFYDEFFGSVQ
jgi:hypothetical protein